MAPLYTLWPSLPMVLFSYLGKLTILVLCNRVVLMLVINRGGDSSVMFWKVVSI